MQGAGQEAGADLPHFNVRFAGRELPNAQAELRSMHKLPHGLLHFMRSHSSLKGLPAVEERACRRVHLTLEMDCGIAVKTDKTALKPGDMQSADGMLTLTILNLGRTKQVHHVYSYLLLNLPDTDHALCSETMILHRRGIFENVVMAISVDVCSRQRLQTKFLAACLPMQ